jgi:hypothetical protein
LSSTTGIKAQVASGPGKDSVLVSIRNFRTVCLPSISNDNFLLVVDGEVRSPSVIKELNPDQIETILVLKPEALSLFGNRPSLPTVIVNLKKTTRIIEIVSSVDGSVVPFADVWLISLDNADSIVARTDINGRLEIKNKYPDKRYLIEVRAFQFQPISDTVSLIRGISQKVELIPETKELEAVIVNANGKAIRCSFGCWISGLTSCLIHNNKMEPTLNGKLFLFPNPARRGQFIRLDLQQLDQDDLKIQVHQISGQQVLDQKVAGGQIVSLPVDSRWSAGVYLVSVSTDNKWLYREKIIVE